MTEQSDAERLMGVLITKMESMDNELDSLKRENMRLQKMLSNPTQMLKKMGLVKSTTPLTENVMNDAFRNDMSDDSIMKGVNSTVPQTNEEFHSMSWEDIHEMALSAKQNEA
tara:strand:- start:188 stop:523 length:336 start_codon:yes stop_codon:yes gene_type:complete